MKVGTSDFELTMDELRVVARYAAEAAQEVLLASILHEAGFLVDQG